MGLADGAARCSEVWGSAAVMAGGQLHLSGAPFTAFSAESRWLLPGSDLGPGVPCCKEAEAAASLVHQKPVQVLSASPDSKGRAKLSCVLPLEASSPQAHISFCSAAMVVRSRDSASQAVLLNSALICV